MPFLPKADCSNAVPIHEACDALHVCRRKVFHRLARKQSGPAARRARFPGRREGKSRVNARYARPHRAFRAAMRFPGGAGREWVQALADTKMNPKVRTKRVCPGPDANRHIAKTRYRLGQHHWPKGLICDRNPKRTTCCWAWDAQRNSV